MTAELPTIQPPAPRLPPPAIERGAIGWLHHHLFRTWRDTALTVVLVAIIGWVLISFASWIFTTARWGVITDNLRLFLIGLYPAGEAWRVGLCLTSLSILGGATAGSRG